MLITYVFSSIETSVLNVLVNFFTQSFLKQLGQNPNLGIVVMPQFSETAAFRSCFPSWKDESESEGLNVDFSKPKGTGSNVGKDFT